MEKTCIVLTTTGTEGEAQRLAEGLVAERLAACVQVLSVTSTYIWQGQLHRDPEWLLLIKTPAARYSDVEAYIREHHSYEVPEIIQVPIQQGLAAYLAWVEAMTLPQANAGSGGGR
ncbi:MAG: divalent-cation tolerance protein CutA [Anaerolineae bacterium]|nr:divalent-cation tolerance protein CutA [Anaerolineae bacterium]MDW8067390.1 divalent-cation tolerance protein CutA [Anaerolineae bacterium]